MNALSLAPDARDWLAISRHPRILHIFDHACNLINERGEVLSIVTPQIGNGPFNLVIPRPRKSFGGLSDRNRSLQISEVFPDISLESPISNSPTQLHLGDLTINTADAKLWSPRLNWEMLHDRRDDILSHIMSLRGAQLATKQSPRSVGDCFGRTNTVLAMTVSQLPITTYQFSNSLTSAVASADLSSSLIAAKHLAGLGQGLTPAGDDFLMGAMYAIWIIHPQATAKVLASEIANAAAPLTTSLSAAWLKSAGRGEAGILWHNLFNSLILPIPNLESPVSQILSTGETSGADALAGFIGTFISYAESETKPCPS